MWIHTLPSSFFGSPAGTRPRPFGYQSGFSCFLPTRTRRAASGVSALPTPVRNSFTKTPPRNRISSRRSTSTWTTSSSSGSSRSRRPRAAWGRGCRACSSRAARCARSRGARSRRSGRAPSPAAPPTGASRPRVRACTSSPARSAPGRSTVSFPRSDVGRPSGPKYSGRSTPRESSRRARSTRLDALRRLELAPPRAAPPSRSGRRTAARSARPTRPSASCLGARSRGRPTSPAAFASAIVWSSWTARISSGSPASGRPCRRRDLAAGGRTGTLCSSAARDPVAGRVPGGVAASPAAPIPAQVPVRGAPADEQSPQNHPRRAHRRASSRPPHATAWGQERESYYRWWTPQWREGNPIRRATGTIVRRARQT